MKTLFLSCCAVLVLAAAASAQRQPPPRPEPALLGTWVVESNAKTKAPVVVKFYNETHELIYEETLAQRRLDIRRPQVVASLNRALERAFVHWVATKQFEQNQGWLTASLKK
jgi:hypothetical protein